MSLQLTQAARAWLLTSMLLLITLVGQAQTTTTYTAIANGNYTSAATWQGGIKPPPVLGDTLLLVENVVIPQGITVTLDTNLIFDNTLKPGIASGSLTVNGTLNALPNYYIVRKGGLSGSTTGIINVDSIAIYGLAYSYQGKINANIALVSNYYNHTNTVLSVSKKLLIPYQSDNHNYGTINILNHCHIVKEAQSGLRNSGTFNIVDTVNLTYNYKWGGLLPSGDRILDSNWMAKKVDTLLIHVHEKYGVPANPLACKLMKDMYFDGTMIIKSGGLRLDGYKLTLGPNAKVFCSPDSAWILGDPQASIEVKANNDLGGGLLFFPGDVVYPSLDTLKELTMNMGNASGSVKLYGDLYIANKLDLKKGLLHLVDTANLFIDNNANVTNASTNSYITNDFGSGTHRTIVNNNTVNFPVGSMTAYAPIGVKNNATSTKVYKVGCRGGVLDSATHGFDIPSQEPCVAATWWVKPSTTTGSNADILFNWPTSLEVNGFDRSQSFITTYLHNQTKWDTQTSTSAATQSGNFYTHTETVNNFSATNDNFFSVFDGMTSLQYLSVNNISLNGKATLYPNPTSGYATLSLNINKAQTIAITITDLSGRVVYAKAASLYTSGQHSLALPTSNLQAGMYLLQLTNEQGTVLNSGKLIKQ